MPSQYPWFVCRGTGRQSWELGLCLCVLPPQPLRRLLLLLTRSLPAPPSSPALQPRPLDISGRSPSVRGVAMWGVPVAVLSAQRPRRWRRCAHRGRAPQQRSLPCRPPWLSGVPDSALGHVPDLLPLLGWRVALVGRLRLVEGMERLKTEVFNDPSSTVSPNVILMPSDVPNRPPVSYDEVTKLINSLKPNKALGAEQKADA
ncbi:UNVERIFIED_CONTAM: hypothetical protein K2H54_004502 [Gekko kuhli]